MGKQKGKTKRDLAICYQFSLMFVNIFRNILCTVIDHLADFDVPTESGFRVIQKIVFASLCKIYHFVTIIQFFYFHFEWKKIGQRGSITKN